MSEQPQRPPPMPPSTPNPAALPEDRTPEVRNPEAETLNDHIAVRIVRVSEAMSRIATRRIEARWGLRNTDLRVLNILDGSAPFSIAEISRRTHVDKAWISRTVRDLVQRGLVTRARHPSDFRQALVSLTPKGREMLEEVRPLALRDEATLLAGVDGARLKAMLDRVESNAEAMLDEG